MSRTEQDRAWHEAYEQLQPRAHETVDRAFKQVVKVFQMNGFKVTMDDRAENAVAAMARYLILSNPEEADLLSGSRHTHSPRGAEETANDKIARDALRKLAVRHKDIFGMAETKSLIMRFGQAAALAYVPLENVASLCRVLRGQIERGKPSERVFHVSRGPGRVTVREAAARAALAAPYNSAGRMMSEGDGSGVDPYKTAALALAFGEHPGPVTKDEIDPLVCSTYTKEGIEHTIVRGDGGSFDGGGASAADWSDASPSSTDPS